MKRWFCAAGIFICSLHNLGWAKTNILLQSDLSALLKNELVLSKDTPAYDPGTVHWAQDQLVQLSKNQPEWQLPVLGFTPGVFDEKLAGALLALQKNLGLSQSHPGALDADSTRALLALMDYTPARKELGSFAYLNPQEAMQKNLLWAGPNRFYPETFLRPLYQALGETAPPADAGLMLFTEQLGKAVREYETRLGLARTGLADHVHAQNYAALLHPDAPLASKAVPGETLPPTASIGQTQKNSTKKSIARKRKLEAPPTLAASLETPDDLRGVSYRAYDQDLAIPSAQVLYFAVGETRPLALPVNLQSIAVGDPTIADVRSVGSRQLLVTALKNGDTSLSMLFEDNTHEQYTLSIEKSYQHLRSEMFRLKYVVLQNTAADADLTNISVKSNEEMITAIKNLLSSILPDTRFSIFPVLSSILVRGSDEEISKVASLVQRIDRPIDQLVLHARVIEVQSEAAKTLGFSEALQSNQIDASFVPDSTAGGIVTFTRGASFTAALVSRINALITEGKAKTLANPRILAQSGEVSDIYVGRQIPMVTQTSLGATSVQQIESGIKLAISPRVNDDQSITTWIGTFVSNPTTTLYSGIPEIVTRRAQTTVRIENGNTIVLGGLKSAEYSNTVKKFPILGDIPLLGEFFKSTSQTLKESDIIITLTPYILSASLATY